MRRDLAQRMLGAIQQRLFEDVVIEVDGAPPVPCVKAISGVNASVDRFDDFGVSHRVSTHTTFGIAALLPGLGKGHFLVTTDGRYRVADIQPAGDGRFEIEISLDKVA